MMQIGNERKTVRKKVDTISVEYMDVKDVISELQRILETYGPTARIEKARYAYSNSDDDSYLAITVEVQETDEEMAARIMLQERIKLEQEERNKR